MAYLHDRHGHTSLYIDADLIELHGHAGAQRRVLVLHDAIFRKRKVVDVHRHSCHHIASLPS